MRLQTFRLSFICLPLLISAATATEEAGPYRTRAYHSSSRKAAIQWQENLRSDLFHVMKLEPLIKSHASLDLSPTLLSSEQKDGYTFQEFEISTTPTRRIQVVLTLPTSGKDRTFPAVVCIHGHSHDRYAVYDKDSIYKGFAAVLAEREVVTIAANVGQHEVYEEGMILMGERLWDLIRCVDVLESLPEVDRNRIGCAGLSLGGEMAMWLGGMDTRIKATVSAGFLTTMDHMETHHCLCWKFPGLRERVDYPDLYALTAPRALMCQNGLKEPESQFNVPLARKAFKEIEQIYKDFGVPQNLELDVHPGAHEIDLPGLLRFFEEHLSIRKSP